MSRVRFLFDEDFNGHIVRGFRRRQPDVDARTAREAGLEGADDPTVLKWAAENRRLLVSHDRRTMTAAAERLFGALQGIVIEASSARELY